MRVALPYRYREDIALADAAFEAWGDTPAELFRAAADATVNVMIEELAAIQPRLRRSISLGPDTIEMLLYGLLQELIFYKDAEQLLLRIEAVHLTPGPAGYGLVAEAAGETIDPGRHPLGADVKAVTLHRFEVVKTERGWRAFVILDV